MKSNFEECMARLLAHEGGYVWHAEDPGGETNFGVTRAVYEQYAGRQVMDGEMEGLTHDDVYPIGPMTLQAVAEMEPADIIEQMHHMRDNFYRDLSTFDTFGRGWIRRNDETKEQALGLIE